MMNKAIFSSDRNTWETPQDFFEQYNRIYHFNTDVCALPYNTKCAHFYTPADNGLHQQWKGTVWMNPPYGRNQTGLWVKKAYEESRKGIVVVALVPSRTDSPWFHNYIYKKEGEGITCEFIKGRLKFVGAKDYAPFPSLVVVFRLTQML